MGEGRWQPDVSPARRWRASRARSRGTQRREGIPRGIVSGVEPQLGPIVLDRTAAVAERLIGAPELHLETARRGPVAALPLELLEGVVRTALGERDHAEPLVEPHRQRRHPGRALEMAARIVEPALAEREAREDLLRA